MAGTFVIWILNMERLIPIKNLWFIFLYAWRRLEEGKAIDVGEVDSPELADLFAKVLIGGLKHIFRRGIDRGYIPITEDLSVLRGRIRVYESMQQSIRRSPIRPVSATRTRCKTDERLQNPKASTAGER